LKCLHTSLTVMFCGPTKRMTAQRESVFETCYRYISKQTHPLEVDDVITSKNFAN